MKVNNVHPMTAPDELPSWSAARGNSRMPAAAVDTAILRAQMRQHLADHFDAYPSQLERHFPHVLARIVELWGSRQMDPYFQSLLVSDRPTGQGFPAEVAKEVFGLSVIHDALGLVRAPISGGWSGLTGGDIDRWRQQRM